MGILKFFLKEITLFESVTNHVIIGVNFIMVLFSIFFL